MNDPYIDLANAIVKQAAVDYMAALKKLKHGRSNKSAAREAAEIEEFFHSDLYLKLTSVDPDYLIQKLREKVGE